MSAQVAADLRAAAEVLRRDGWTQGTNGLPGACKCLVGALSFAVSDGTTTSDGIAQFSGPPETTARWRSVVAALPIASDRYVESLIDWNDEPLRTADEVIAALEAAAQAAETHRADGQH